ncbi:DODA-type extradiol aromatic ring-opening family dioxygenase [Thiothrix eikelboomii]|uniref:DODA-type extradiol aromatic ring-opening family dioxygenase n=1 Tax=Thiothrix eikelboomii TaxID=92487 RepID=UPI003BAEA90C
MPMPILFVSHGSPDIALQTQAPTLACWQQLGEYLERPKAILVVSAHWETSTPTLSTTTQPKTIYDFGGFPAPLYRLSYPAAGAPELASQLQTAFTQANLPLKTDTQRGLDHGAWIPLLSLFPAADIPVAQLSIQTQAGPAWHLKLGQALQSLRTAGVLILASGAVTHNFAWLSPTAEPWPAAFEFSNWLADKLQARAQEELITYRTTAPYGSAAHPTEEHILPLFVAFGASTHTDQLKRFTPEVTYSALVMDAYLWETE